MKRIYLVVSVLLLASACAKKKVPQVPAPPPPPQATAPEVKEQSPVPVPPKPKKPTPTPSPVPAVTPNAPPPQLGEILSPERRRQLEKEFDDSIGRAKAVLDKAAKVTLNAEQRNNASRIRTFIAQAITARGKDLTTALQLARRADLLGVDLSQSLR